MCKWAEDGCKKYACKSFLVYILNPAQRERICAKKKNNNMSIDGPEGPTSHYCEEEEEEEESGIQA